MSEEGANTVARLKAAMDRILRSPTPEDLWQLQRDLLALGGEEARRAREVAGLFCSYLRTLGSKLTSRRASRWAAALETAAVTSVSLRELFEDQEEPLRNLLSCGISAALELGAATANVRAWEVESSLVHCDMAWHLYGELWEISSALQAGMQARERHAYLDRLMGPVWDDRVPGEAKAALLIRLCQVTLAARLLPLLTAEPDGQEAAP